MKPIKHKEGKTIPVVIQPQILVQRRINSHLRTIALKQTFKTCYYISSRVKWKWLRAFEYTSTFTCNERGTQLNLKQGIIININVCLTLPPG